MPVDTEKWLKDCQDDELITRLEERFKAGEPAFKSINRMIYTRDGRLCVPKCRRDEIIRLHHSGSLTGHPGVKGTIEQIERKYFWPELAEDVKRFVSGCDPCLRRKVGKTSQQGLMSSIVSGKPFDTFARSRRV